LLPRSRDGGREIVDDLESVTAIVAFGSCDRLLVI